MEKKDSSRVTAAAGRTYHLSDYYKKGDDSAGLATTHEQVSDTYAEGEIGGVIENVDGEDIPLQRKGYEEE
jgi:hypothetical protein